MFLDIGCETLLKAKRCREELTYRARIFSLNSKEEFLTYLRELEAATSDSTRYYAQVIYGLETADSAYVKGLGSSKLWLVARPNHEVCAC